MLARKGIKNVKLILLGIIVQSLSLFFMVEFLFNTKIYMIVKV